jgi:hypothetical protein
MRLAKYKRFFIAATASNAFFGYQCLLASGEPEDTLETEGLPSGRSSSSDSVAANASASFGAPNALKDLRVLLHRRTRCNP